jgi:hypothetical protein
MAISATVSSTEITRLISDAYVGKYLEARLINAAGTNYTPGVTNDATFLSNEIAFSSGYDRAIIGFELADVGAYADDGVGLNQKATIFTHDGIGGSFNFTHVSLVRSTGNVLTFTSPPSVVPTAGVDGTYANIPIDSTSGSGSGLTVDLVITNSGAAAGDYALTVNKPGYNYAVSEVVTITEGTLQGLGAVAGGAGGLSFSVATVNTDAAAGDVVTVAKPSGTVTLSGGNEAVFYWNFKQYGFYSVN